MLSAVATVLLGIIGFVVVTVLNAFVLDEWDAYGEVPIPGSAEIVLPAGEAKISFHTSVAGSPSSGFPIPPLTVSIDPPAGAADPVVTEMPSGTTTVNSDMHVRIWIAQVETAGTYKIRTAGPVQGYINPRLAFGHESDYDWLHYLFAGIVGLGVLEGAATVMVSKALRRRERASVTTEPYLQSGDSIKNEQLKIVSALRETGALTKDEFEAERRRILES
jgi:hypothetical protein